MALSLRAELLGAPVRRLTGQARVIVRFCKTPFWGKMKLEIGNNTSFVAHFLKCPARIGGAPFLALTKSITLKIIYSIFNSDYTRQGDLNLITKLEGLKTNPPKSDTVD